MIWKDIEGWEGYYQVSNTGLIRSVDRVIKNRHSSGYLKTGIIHKTNIQKDGYHRVALTKDNKPKKYLLHVLVAREFIDNTKRYPLFEVNHKDCDKNNNSVDNLEWVTKAQNIKHAFENKRFPDRHGQRNHNSKLDFQIANKIREEYETTNLSMELLAKKYGVKSQTTICKIVNNKSYIR